MEAFGYLFASLQVVEEDDAHRHRGRNVVEGMKYQNQNHSRQLHNPHTRIMLRLATFNGRLPCLRVPLHRSRLAATRKRHRCVTMSTGSCFGTTFRVTTFGESHGKGVGCVVDGVPPRLPITEEEIQRELDRRRPGQSIITTPRNEEDRCEILSGVVDGITLGTPVAILVRNKDQKSKDYAEMEVAYRYPVRIDARKCEMEPLGHPMLMRRMTLSTGFVRWLAADDPQPEKRLDAWQQELLQRNSFMPLLAQRSQISLFVL